MSQIDQNSLLGDEQESQKTSSNSAPSTGSNANAGVVAPNATGSGRFQNLQKYVDANQGQGVNQANRLSNATTNDITQFNKDNQAKTDELSSKAQEAQTLFARNGQDYTTALKGWQDSLKTQADILNRGTADTAAQQVKAFTEGSGMVGNGSDFNTFQKLQAGQGYDQQAALDLLSAGMNAGNSTLQNIQNKAKQIQTEEGRYNLLAQAASPYGARSSMGGNRLNQLIFQADPTAVRTLQNQFDTQATGLQNKLTDFNNVGLNTVNPLITQETELQNALNNAATGLQTQYETNFANQNNYDLINNSRQALYDNYVNQLKTGSLDSELTNMLGLNNYKNVYNPNTNLAPLPEGVSAKITPIEIPDPNKLRTYNTLDSSKVSDLGNYLVKSGAKAQSLQDVLSPTDFENYKAFGALSGGPLKATGSSTLSPAVSANLDANGKSKLLNSIMAQDQGFVDNYAGRTYGTHGIGQESYNGAGANQATSDNQGVKQLTDPKTSFDQFQSQAFQWGNNPKDYGTVSFNQALANIDDYVKDSDTAIKNNNRLIFDRGNNNDVIKAQNRAKEASAIPLSQYLDTIMGNTGVKNTTTLNNPNAVDNNPTLAQLRALGLV